MISVSWRAPGGAALCAAAAAVALLPGPAPAGAQSGEPRPQTVRVVSDESGRRLQVNDRDFFVFGMNWDHMPIGQNYTYSLWAQPDDVIEEVLAYEMALLRGMGVNTIRQYVGIPPRWVEHIYETYGIYTVLNHPMARYGYTLDGVWIPSVDYSHPRLREAVKTEILAMVEEFKDTPGVLMWLLGNENNYGLTWRSAETEALPEGERNAARARHLYSLFGEVIDAIHAADAMRPVAIANGDAQYIDIIAEECPGLDVFGSNVYRGISARDLFQVVEDKLHVPLMFTEFGADAWNAREMREDQEMQCRYLVGQWEEIYEQSAGKGRVGNAVGGLTFQWSDGWWKFGLESRLDIHDTNASWPNGGYSDYVEGQNNMNEEWWGVCAKGPPDDRFRYQLYPRAAYYALRQAYLLDPYAPGTDLEAIRKHFGVLQPAAFALDARGDRAALAVDELSRGRLSGLRLELETYSTGGRNVSTPETVVEGSEARPAFQGFDQLQSFYAEFEARPAANLTGRMSVNFLAGVPTNPIDELFYESRARGLETSGDLATQERSRVDVYQAAVRWEDPRFTLDGFYRAGHYHWGYEGDFFGLYREANYGENIDIYNGAAPNGVEIEARKQLAGLKVAFGPELWWGANPTMMAKYRRAFGRFDATAIVQKDISDLGTITSTAAQPRPQTRKATLHVATSVGSFGVEAGGIWAGDDRVGETFTVADRILGYASPDDTVRTEGYVALQDTVHASSLDTFGGRVKVTWEKGRWHWYAQAARMGIVADGGPTATITYTGWSLKDTGSGNQTNFLTGAAVNVGSFQIAPNLLWQKPLVGPVPGGAVWVSPDPGFVPVEGAPRNVSASGDPFEVRANRETRAAELMLTYDPTPATWMWQWDSIAREDARLAASLGFTYRDQTTTMDAFSAFFAVGDELIYGAFPGATPPRELWEVRARVLSRLRPDLRIVANLYGGNAEPNGDDPREVKRVGGDVRVAWDQVVLETYARFNDWGPYDYHRDFNLTFPRQLMGDLSYSFGTPGWFSLPQTKLGVRTTWRSLDRYSARYCPADIPDPTGSLECDPLAPGDDGEEWEIRTYLHFAM
jgi:hypothetical protein